MQFPSGFKPSFARFSEVSVPAGEASNESFDKAMDTLVLDKISSGLAVEDWKSFALVSKTIRDVAVSRVTKAVIKGGDLKSESLLGALPYLTHVVLKSPVKPEHIAALAKKAPNLKSLHFPDGIEDVVLEALSQLPHLTSLCLGSCAIGDQGVKALSALTRLTNLEFSQCEAVTDDVMQILPGLKNLTELTWLKGSAISNAGAQALSGMGNLTSLILTDCGVEDEHMPALSRLTQLTYLSLGQCRITDGGLSHLSSLTELRKLHLFWCLDLTDHGLNALAALPKLTTLNLICCTLMGREGLTALPKFKHLTALSLAHCFSVFDDCLEGLPALSHLSSLNLRSCGVSDEGVKNLQKKCPDLKISLPRSMLD